MSRILLVHWNEDEAGERAARLRKAGHDVHVHARAADGAGLRKIRRDPPDVAVVDLTRLPSHGRDVGIWLRQQKDTRLVSLVFVEGDPEKTNRVRRVLPDAEYTDWKKIRGAIRRAVDSAKKSAAKGAARKPVVPDTMAGYSGTPLSKKLGLKEGSRVVLLDAPAGFSLGELPAGVKPRSRAGVRTADVAVLFLRRRADLARRFDAAARTVDEGGRLWLAWPKKTSPLAGDLGQADVRKHGMDAGWVDFKVAAIDADWSGLAFARREAKARKR